MNVDDAEVFVSLLINGDSEGCLPSGDWSVDLFEKRLLPGVDFPRDFQSGQTALFFAATHPKTTPDLFHWLTTKTALKIYQPINYSILHAISLAGRTDLAKTLVPYTSISKAATDKSPTAATAAAAAAAAADATELKNAIPLSGDNMVGENKNEIEKWIRLKITSICDDDASVKEKIEEYGGVGVGGWTCLHLASAGGHGGMVYWLLQHGASANVNDVDGDGRTPLMLAVTFQSADNVEFWTSSRLDVVRHLVAHGATLHAKSGRTCQNIFHLLAKRNSCETITEQAIWNIILFATDKKSAYGKTDLNQKMDEKSGINAADTVPRSSLFRERTKRGNSSMHLAALYHARVAFENLFHTDGRVDLFSANSRGRLPFHLLFSLRPRPKSSNPRYTFTDWKFVEDMLVIMGCDVGCQLPHINTPVFKGLETVLQRAIKLHAPFRVLDLLMMASADLWTRNQLGYNALEIAAQEHPKFLIYLFQTQQAQISRLKLQLQTVANLVPVNHTSQNFNPHIHISTYDQPPNQYKPFHVIQLDDKNEPTDSSAADANAISSEIIYPPICKDDDSTRLGNLISRGYLGILLETTDSLFQYSF